MKKICWLPAVLVMSVSALLLGCQADSSDRYVIREGQAVSGSELMQEFLDAAAGGEAAHVRIAAYSEEEESVTDLYFEDGGYWMVRDGKEEERVVYSYLRYMHNPVTSDTGSKFLVLTDSVDLTYNRVLYDPLYSSLPPFVLVVGAFEDKEVDWTSVWCEYQGFEELELSSAYTPKQAYEDGCYVNIGYEEFLGEERLEEFLERSGNGEGAFLRIVEFHEDEENPGETRVHCGDLLYENGKYRYFTSSDESSGRRVSQLGGRAYQYLRKLPSEGYSDPERASVIYVLTDDPDLSHGDIIGAFLSSQSGAVDELPDFEWITGLRL